jgi:hypothetical protein
MRSSNLKSRRASEISHQAIRKPLQSPAKTPASPIEISYNYLEDLEQLYRVEVELIVVEEWQKALNVLFTDLLDSNGGISRVETAMPGLPTLRSRSFAPGYDDHQNSGKVTCRKSSHTNKKTFYGT